MRLPEAYNCSHILFIYNIPLIIIKYIQNINNVLANEKPRVDA